jgi:hypothetical protein
MQLGEFAAAFAVASLVVVPARGSAVVLSPQGKATDRIQLFLPLHLPLFFAFAFSFRVFSPKIVCQAPKPLKPNKQNKIELAY